ncbi:MAG: BadF/BadG/BcrA/BcrD ATPase family protein [Armatimonadota bacterium]|nr:BadF/BadG/BcrA/BcrD ATPase family protein [Armatimonadota bacterium]
MTYILGVDGGGSKTEAAVIDENRRVLGRGLAGGSNTNFVSRKEAVSSYVSAVKQALDEAGLRPQQIAAAGCTFCSAAPDAFAELGLQVKPIPIGEHQVAFERAGLQEVYGVVLIAGTGSSCFGFGKDGRRFHAGGHGPLLGDEGGGYDIGLQALRTALKAEEGRKPPTMLVEAACEYFGVRNARSVVSRLAGLQIEQPLIAGFAARVAECARQGDEAALEILRYAGTALGELAAFVAGRIFDRADRFPVVLAGGVFNAGDLVVEPLRAVVSAQFPGADYAAARMNPGEAAARVTLKLVESRGGK